MKISRIITLDELIQNNGLLTEEITFITHLLHLDYKMRAEPNYRQMLHNEGYLSVIEFNSTPEEYDKYLERIRRYLANCDDYLFISANLFSLRKVYDFLSGTEIKKQAVLVPTIDSGNPTPLIFDEDDVFWEEAGKDIWSIGDRYSEDKALREHLIKYMGKEREKARWNEFVNLLQERGVKRIVIGGESADFEIKDDEIIWGRTRDGSWEYGWQCIYYAHKRLKEEFPVELNIDIAFPVKKQTILL